MGQEETIKLNDQKDGSVSSNAATGQKEMPSKLKPRGFYQEDLS